MLENKMMSIQKQDLQLKLLYATRRGREQGDSLLDSPERNLNSVF